MKTTISRSDLAALELLEAKVLQQIFAQAVCGRLVLKGGLAMRLLYGSSRATQDIDLNASSQVSLASLEKTIGRAIERTIVEMRTAGLITAGTYTIPKETDTTCRWKVSVDLSAGRKLHFKIEVSRRRQDSGEETETLMTRPSTLDGIHIPPAMVNVYSAGMLAGAKTAALLAENRDRARDVYDLYVLIQSETKPSATLREWLIARMGRTGETVEQIVDTLYGKLDAMDYHQAREQIVDYLDPGISQGFTLDLWEQMKTRVGLTVESWLREADEDSGGPSP